MNQQDNNQKKSDVALREEKVLAYWQERDIFQKTLNKKSPKGEFVFYDGPPYATGLPHYGHLLPGTMKDVIPRYKTMQGYRVPRQWGWDCHGLPIENLIQKELELPTKQDIVDYGIEKFNQAARDSVLRYEKDWKEYIPRVGRFVDMADPYKTMDISYMEGVWGVFKNLHDKGLVYKGYKSMMVSPPLETVLSNQEVNMGGYKDITDLSVTAKFTITDGKHKGVHLLAWTTTPWTLPGNALVAVGADIDYGIIRSEDETYVVGLDLLESAFEGKEYEVLETVKGQDLVGVSYEPPFSYFKNHANAFRVVAGDFVTTEDGTGLVHIAPGFGEDDLQLGQKENVEPIHHVKMDGHFVKKVEQSLSDEGYDVAGWAVKNTDDHMHVDVEMVKYLAHNGKLFSFLCKWVFLSSF
jgi:isoleucyl-tRNA synthetase